MNAEPKTITLTVADLIETLQAVAGFKIEIPKRDEDDMETEICLVQQEGGIEIKEDEKDEKPKRYRLGAYYYDYPEEGTYPIGKPIE